MFPELQIVAAFSAATGDFEEYAQVLLLQQIE
jgi:hypothetical protein